MDSPQQVCETYPVFQNKVFEMALHPDPAMTGVALDTLGLLGSTVEGKQVLQKTGQACYVSLVLFDKSPKGAATSLRISCVIIANVLCDACVPFRRKVQGGVVKNESARQLRSDRAPSAQLGRHNTTPHSTGT